MHVPTRPRAEHLAVHLAPQLAAERMCPHVTDDGAAPLRESPPLAHSFRVAAPCLRIPAAPVSHSSPPTFAPRRRGCRLLTMQPKTAKFGLFTLIVLSVGVFIGRFLL
jgi:hypothetical protein